MNNNNENESQENIIVCKECGIPINKKLFAGHVKYHMTYESYVLKWDHNNEHPLCKCGCGQKVNWHKKLKKFNVFIHGHQHNDESIRQLMIEGGRKPMNDPIIKQRIINKLKDWWANDDNLEKRQKVIKIWSKAMREGHKKACVTQEYHDAISTAQKLRWESESGEKQRELMKTDEWKEKVSNATKIALSDPECRKVMSTKAAEHQMNGIIGPNMTKRFWELNPFIESLEHFDSGWEFEFLQEAIRRNIPIKRNKDIRIQYFIDDIQRTYVPDFISLTGLSVIEIKGMMTKIDEIKISTAIEYFQNSNINFVVFKSLKEIHENNELWSLII